MRKKINFDLTCEQLITNAIGLTETNIYAIITRKFAATQLLAFYIFCIIGLANQRKEKIKRGSYT